MAYKRLKPSQAEFAVAVPENVEGNRGGARPGAGRKSGRPRGKTVVKVPQAAKGGLTPLHVLLEGMRFWHQQYRSNKVAKKPPPGTNPRSKIAQEYARKQRFAAECIDRATRAADLAAPYIHARLAATANFGGGNSGDTPEALQEARKALEERFAGLSTAAREDAGAGAEKVPKTTH